MRYIIILLICFVTDFVFAQHNKDTDSLKKYSYLIYGQNERVPTNGTGFFIKHKEQLFFVTARHILTGCRNIKGVLTKIKNQPDTMYIYNNRFREQYGHIIKSISDTSNCYRPHLQIDVMPFKIPNYIIPKIYSVENFVGNPLIEYKQFAIWGYPFYNMLTEGEYDISKPPSLLYQNMPDFSMGFPTKDIDNKIEDSLNYVLETKNLFTEDDLGGYSGSPLFLKDRKTNKWHIIGTFISAGSNSPKRRFIFVRITEILKEIDKICEQQKN